MSPHREAEKALKQAGYIVKRTTGGHAIWYNARLGATITLKNHDFNDNDLKYIIKEIRQAEERTRGK